MDGTIDPEKGTMKLCAKCNAGNEDAAARCRACGAEFAQAGPRPEPAPEAPADDAPFEKIAVLDSEVQAELLDGVLSGQDIPHFMQSYHDSAYDGLFQAQRGWGHVAAPAQFRDEILATIENLKRQAEQSEPPPAGPGG